MAIIEKYYKGIYRQIQSEVEFINDLFIHQGLKGEGNETLIRELLKRFIPKKYGIGTGIVIDRNGKSSKQCDIVIFDNYNYPEIFTLSNVHIFPVDLVYATIEVKTTLDKKQAKLAIDNIKSVRQLDYIKDSYRVNPSKPIDFNDKNCALWENKSTTPPLGLVFSYYSKSANFETISNWFNFSDKEEQTIIPSHIFCLDHGFILTQSGNKPESILCPLLKGSNYYKIDYNDDNSDIILKNNKKWGAIDKTFYPISKFKKEEIFIDQSKIFLNFIMILNVLLKDKTISPNLDIRKEFFTDELRTFFRFRENKIEAIKF